MVLGKHGFEFLLLARSNWKKKKRLYRINNVMKAMFPKLEEKKNKRFFES